MESAASGDSGGGTVANLTNGEVEHAAAGAATGTVNTVKVMTKQVQRPPQHPAMSGGGGGKKFCLPIQAVIHEYRLKHGLRHQDFFRYRGYCSRRLKHIRKTLKFTQSSHKKHFHKRPVNEDSIRDLRYLEILLLNAERAWAYSVQLKDESELEPRRMHHSVRKLAHACEVAKQLEKICNLEGGGRCKVDGRTSLEAKAYYHYMEGLYCQTKRDWSKALNNLKNSVALYEKIKVILPEEKREPYEMQISEVKPLINFCSYNMGDSSEAMDIPAVSELVADFDKLKLLKSNVGIEEQFSFSWLGQTVQLKLPYWKNFMATMENFKSEIHKAINEESKISVLDNLLDETRQVQAKLREEAKSSGGLAKQPTGAKMANGVSSAVDNPIMFLLGYVTFIKLTKGIQKNIFFLYSLVAKEGSNEIFSDAAKKLKPQSFLKFFESCVEFIEEILSIEYVEQFGQFSNLVAVLNSQKKALSSFSLYELGRCYSAQNEWTNSLALFSRSKQIAAAVNENDLISDAGDDVMDCTLISALLRNFLVFIQSEIYCAYTFCISNQYSCSSSQTALQETNAITQFEGTLDQNLNQWIKLSPSTLKNLKITSLPPEYKPVPAKPLFFDIASNHVKLPPAVQAKIQATNQAKGGIGGYFRGWWGGGQK